ncbi:hypothetical protein H6F51_21450 [Cyanobacteria bacterium FACHB-DQ100]|nr:hypothetical protein [Cyanobacteria bacterium FACHB-DQ100]
MPSPTIRLRVTERLAALIERVWKAAPELRDDFPATVLNALALYAEYREGRPSIFGSPKPNTVDSSSAQSSEPTQPTEETAEDETPIPDDEWA